MDKTRKGKKAAVCLLLSVLTLALAGCASSNRLRMGTGSSAGNYYSYGNVLGGAAQKQGSGLELEIKETAGSAANLRLMKEGFLDLAIVQSDVLSQAIRGEGEFAGKAYENVRVVAGLYMEQCQIVVAADSDFTQLADLDGKRVSVGQQESGVSVVAREILKAAGLNESKMTLSHLSFSESAEALAKGEIDAFFLVAGAPAPAVTELAKSTPVRLLPLDERILSYMLNLYGGYVRTTVPAGSYAGQEEEVSTIGVKAVLVADEGISEQEIEKLTQLLFQSGADIRYGTALSGEPDLSFATKEIPGYFHSGAAAYYRQKNLTVETISKSGKKHFIFGGQDN